MRSSYFPGSDPTDSVLSFGFFAFLIILWVMAPVSDSSVLTTFNDNGWGSSGLACLVGISAPVVSTIGAVCCTSDPDAPRIAADRAVQGLTMPFVRRVEERQQDPPHQHAGHGPHKLHPRFHYARHVGLLHRRSRRSPRIADSAAIRRNPAERDAVEGRDAHVDRHHLRPSRCMRGQQRHLQLTTTVVFRKRRRTAVQQLVGLRPTRPRCARQCDA